MVHQCIDSLESYENVDLYGIFPRIARAIPSRHGIKLWIEHVKTKKLSTQRARGTASCLVGLRRLWHIREYSNNLTR